MSIFQKGCILSKVASIKGKSFYKKAIICLCKMLKYNFFYTGLTKLVTKEKKYRKRVYGMFDVACLWET